MRKPKFYTGKECPNEEERKKWHNRGKLIEFGEFNRKMDENIFAG